VSPKRQSAEQFSKQWKEVTDKLRAAGSPLSDEEICNEVNDFRAGR
jgi:hypothetical protein